MNTATGLWVAAALALASGYAAADDGFTKKFPLERCLFLSAGGSGYFPLVPGKQLYYSNSACVAAHKCDALHELWITTERDTRRISLPIGHGERPVFARVIEERETEGGELIEVSRNYFADCFPSHDVYYFGEEVDTYANGELTGHEGAWLAGKQGALPGIVMPADGFINGSRYYQEVAPGVALDRSEHTRVGFSVDLPAGKFDNCVQVRETTPLEPGEVETKVYCRGVGLVRDEDLELTAIYWSPH